MDDGEVTAVLCALAGPRRGDRVALVGAPALAGRALLVATGTTAVTGTARLALAGRSADDAREAAARLAPGGRLVALAGTAEQARERAGALGLRLRHVEPVGEQVAWSAVASEVAPHDLG